MADTSDNTDPWREAGGGFRGSTLLIIGAITLAGAGLVQLVVGLSQDGGTPAAMPDEAARLAYFIGLWVVGAGFTWAGAHPCLGRFGLVVAVLYLAQCVLLLLDAYTHTPVATELAIVSFGLLVGLLVFAWLEAPSLGATATRWLAAAAGLALLHTGWTWLGQAKRLGTKGESLLETGLLVFLAWALFCVGRAARRAEAEWAADRRHRRTEKFAEFNNPEHDWNKPRRKTGS